MKRKIHVIPHSHWDREWYFTTSRSKVYLMKDLGDVLNTLENDPEFKYFMVDAQGSLLDDYIKWRPQDKERISKLVNDGRIPLQLIMSDSYSIEQFDIAMQNAAAAKGLKHVIVF